MALSVLWNFPPPTLFKDTLPQPAVLLRERNGNEVRYFEDQFNNPKLSKTYKT